MPSLPIVIMALLGIAIVLLVRHFARPKCIRCGRRVDDLNDHGCPKWRW